MTLSRRLLRFLPLALVLTAAGCATHVAVDSTASPVATYNWGTLKGDIKGDLDSTFHATNVALDNLGYFRVGQNVGKSEIEVIARGIQDIKVTVDLTPSKIDGCTTVAIEVGGGNLPKSQAIFTAINKQLGN
ncbi:MAG: DUF3568 family protein [Opitutales bacterium]|jgi:hypothetical protein